MLKILLITLFLFVSLTGVAGQVSGDEVNRFVLAEMARQKIPGVALAVVKDGKPTVLKGYGFANLEHQVPVKPETVFQSGSVGKQFTAMAVMMLVEEGKIGLDDPLSKYFADLPDSWKPLTVRQLLTHTSGLGDYPRDFDLQKDASEEEIFKQLQKTSPTFSAGEKWAYSNVAYVTLGVLVRKVSGQFYGDFLRDRVFKPLGMTTARVISESDIVLNRAAGYVLRNGEVTNQRWVAPTLNTTADGALYLTLHDMIKWDEALAGGKLLSRAGYESMWTPVKLSEGKDRPYGFGWALRKVNGKSVIEHGGAWQGFKAHIARYPESKLTVIVFANLAQANTEAIAHGIAGIVDPTLKPPALTPMADPDPAHTTAMKQLFEQVIEGTADMAKFTEQMHAVFKSQTQMSAMLKGFGPIKSFSFIDKADGEQGARYRYKVEWESEAVVLNVAINKDGKIAGYGLRRE
jgi:CubicO group peptidase (beta-lactamase class C family)